MIDFGCGTAARIAALIDFCGSRYIGIDSSLDALRQAVRFIPRGLFIRADLNSVNLYPRTADIVLSLGILMYFEDSAAALERLVDCLKPGGFMLVHEQIHRKSWGVFAAKLLRLGQRNYPEAYSLHLSELCEGLRKFGFVAHKHLAGSPLRTLSIKLLDSTRLEALRPLAAWADSVWCSTVGRVIPAIGAAEVQVVFRKYG